MAPKGGPIKGKDKNGNKGWVDKNGNIWVPVPDGSPQAHGGGHWDVQRPDGKGYVNKYPGGTERAGSGKRPNIPISKYDINHTTQSIIEGLGFVGTSYLIYRIIRFIPSLIPPLWATIPLNAVTP